MPSTSGSAGGIAPGRQARVLHGEGVETPASLLVWAKQNESMDDGGSQSPLGTLRFVAPGGEFRIEFDLLEGAVLPLPQVAWELRVQNCNQAGQPDVEAHAIVVSGNRPTVASRSFAIGYEMQRPNIRVPAATHAVFFDHGLPDHMDYRALLSDSATGETYGLLPPRSRREVNRGTRYVRFMELPEGAMGFITFVLQL